MFGQDVAEHFYELLTNRAWAFEMNLGDVLLSDSWLMSHFVLGLLKLLTLFASFLSGLLTGLVSRGISCFLPPGALGHAGAPYSHSHRLQ